MSAAPDLLAALRATVSVLERCDAETNYGDQEQCTDEEWNEALTNARAAIAAAEGSK